MKTRSHAANTSRSLPSRVMAVLLSAVLFCTGLSLGSFASAEELPVLETDVSQASSGNLLIGIQGTYIDQISEALDLINSYRLEACQNGYPNPDGSGSLTMSDYEPIQWSDGLEYIGTDPCRRSFPDRRSCAYQRRKLLCHSGIGGDVFSRRVSCMEP